MAPMEPTSASTTTVEMPSTTLVSLMQNDLVLMATLVERHGSAATIAEVLLGIVSNTGKYLEAWPPANRTYYVIMPNFLNMPSFMFDLGAPKNLTRAVRLEPWGRLPYCTSHTCTFAIRRGVPANKLTSEVLSSRGQTLFTPVEQSVIDVVEHLGHMPSTLTPETRQTLRKRVNNDANVKWILLAIAMMGFLNKSMDALGLPLEIPTYRETCAVLGADWSPRSNDQVIDPEVHTATAPPTADGLWTYLSMLPQAPGAARYERRVLAGLPDSPAKTRESLQTLTGYDFLLLSQLQHSRGIRTVTASMYENLNPALSIVGMATKVAVGMVFVTIVQSMTLRTLVRAIAAHNQVETALLNVAAHFATAEDDGELSAEPSDATMAALLRVARAVSTSPAKTDENVATACRDASVSSAALVEVVSLMSALQLLYRLTEFYLPEEETQAQE